MVDRFGLVAVGIPAFVARPDLDPAWLHRFGNFPNEIYLEQAIFE
jgi:hypothetical protein